MTIRGSKAARNGASPMTLASDSVDPEKLGPRTRSVRDCVWHTRPRPGGTGGCCEAPPGALRRSASRARPATYLDLYLNGLVFLNGLVSHSPEDDRARLSLVEAARREHGRRAGLGARPVDELHAIEEELLLDHARLQGGETLIGEPAAIGVDVVGDGGDDEVDGIRRGAGIARVRLRSAGEILQQTPVPVLVQQPLRCRCTRLPAAGVVIQHPCPQRRRRRLQRRDVTARLFRRTDQTVQARPEGRHCLEDLCVASLPLRL